MRYLHLLTFTLLAFMGFAQQMPNEVQAGTFKRFVISISAAPEICYRSIINDLELTHEDYQLWSEVIDHRNETETVKLGYTGGLHLSYNVNDRFGFQAGIQYANRGFSTKKIDTEGAIIDPFVPESFKFILHYDYLEIPAKVNFSFGENQIRLTTSAGLSSAFLIKQSRTYIGYYKDTTTRQVFISNDPYDRFNLFAAISAGLEMHISPIMRIKVEPTFRYGLLKITDTPVSGHWYSGGLNVSYLVRL